jgi:hypothetical protein
MEFWKKPKKKNTTTLGALEKTMKKKITTLRFWPRRKRPQPWSFRKKQEEDHDLGSFGKNHEEEDRTHGSFGKDWDCKKTKPIFFYSPRFLPKSYKHERRKLEICVDL